MYRIRASILHEDLSTENYNAYISIHVNMKLIKGIHFKHDKGHGFFLKCPKGRSFCF